MQQTPSFNPFEVRSKPNDDRRPGRGSGRVSIPSRYDPNPKSATTTHAEARKFQSLRGTIQTPVADPSPVTPFPVSIPSRYDPNVNVIMGLVHFILSFNPFEVRSKLETLLFTRSQISEFQSLRGTIQTSSRSRISTMSPEFQSLRGTIQTESLYTKMPYKISVSIPSRYDPNACFCSSSANRD